MRPFYLYNGNSYTWKDDLYIETEPSVCILHEPSTANCSSVAVGLPRGNGWNWLL